MRAKRSDSINDSSARAGLIDGYGSGRCAAAFYWMRSQRNAESIGARADIAGNPLQGAAMIGRRLVLSAALLVLSGSRPLFAQSPEIATWEATAIKVQPFWLTTTNLRTGHEERALSMLILQVRDKAGQERRVSVSADTAKALATTSAGAPFALDDLRSGAAVRITALRHPKKEGEPGLEYWETSKIVVKANGPAPQRRDRIL